MLGAVRGGHERDRENPAGNLHEPPVRGLGPAQKRAAAAAAHAPVPQESVSPTPRSCTRISSRPTSVSSWSSGTTNSTLVPFEGTGSTTGAACRSRASSFSPSDSTTTVCGLPMSMDTPGRGTVRPWAVTTQSEPRSRASSPWLKLQGPMSTAYPAEVRATVRAPARVPIRTRAPGGRLSSPSRTRWSTKTRTPLPHIWASEPSALR